MTARTRFCLVLCGIAASVTALYAFQREFRVYASLEGYDNVPLPDDYRVPAEFVFGRLMYPPHPRARFSRPIGYGGRFDWREGGTSWSQDYPRADRQFAMPSAASRAPTPAPSNNPSTSTTATTSSTGPG